jgi:LysM repeat protein
MSLRVRLFGALALLGLVAFWWMNRPVPLDRVEVTVVQGDTLGKIARSHGVSVTALRSENDLDGDLIQVGDVLRIPLMSTEAVGAPVRPRRKAEPRVRAPDEGVLVMPRPKPCLGGPSVDSETGMAASEGLSVGAVTSSMRQFLPKLTRCVSEQVPSGQLVVELVVGCDGTVSDVGADDDPGWPVSITECVVNALRFVEFPAHALPDGEYFRYPIGFVDQPSGDGVE